MGEDATALAAGFRRLWELGAGTGRIVQIMAAAADSDSDLLDRVEKAVRELETARLAVVDADPSKQRP
jgi:hypothetical protein